MVSVRSCSGPNKQSAKLMSVRLLHSTIASSPSCCSLTSDACDDAGESALAAGSPAARAPPPRFGRTCTRRNVLSTVNTRRPSSGRRVGSNSVKLIPTRSVAASYLRAGVRDRSLPNIKSESHFQNSGMNTEHTGRERQRVSERERGDRGKGQTINVCVCVCV